MKETLRLDASLRSKLDWSEQIKAAEKFEDFRWYLDFGTLKNKDFKSFQLALEHFMEVVYSQKPADVVVYKGAPSSVQDWKETTLFLSQLVTPILGQVDLIVHLDLHHIASLADQAMMIADENLAEMELEVSHSAFEVTPSAAVGVAVPDASGCEKIYDQLNRALSTMLGKQTPFRLLSQESIISSWEGLDKLIVIQSAVDYDTDRQLQGFIAAGGKVQTEVYSSQSEPSTSSLGSSTN